MMSAPEKRYTYKIFNGTEYIGNIPADKVLSEFNYSQQINTSGTEIAIEIADGANELGATLTTVAVIDENDNNVVDELGNNILASKQYSFDEIPVNLGNRIEVWLYYDQEPDGIVVFDGIIMRWNVDFKTNTTSVIVMSNGIKMQHQLVQILPDETVAEQPTQDSTYSIYGEFHTPTYDRLIRVDQTFQVTADTDITGVYLLLAKSGAGTGAFMLAQLQIIEGTPVSPGSTLITQQVAVSSETVALTFFQFANAISLLQSTDYFIRVTSPYGSNLSESALITLGYNTAAGYASGQVYLYNDISGSSTPGTDLYFRVVSATGGIGNVFTSQDPSDILRDVLDNFNALGGIVTYDDDSIDDTNTTVSYTFKVATIYEAVQKVLELAPGNWYWYADVGSNLINFHRQGNVADHQFELGRDLAAFNLEYSLEGTKNLVYFSGGNDGTGTNIFTTNSSAGSIDEFGTWMSRESDNRVTTEATANTLSQSIIGRDGYPNFRMTFTVISSNYDIETIQLGEMVQIKSGNAIIDSLLLQIESISRYPHNIDIEVNTLPPTVSKRIEDIRRNLMKQETIDNPDGV